MPADFEVAVSKTLAHEGGYVNDPDDPGGETRYGISKRSYPDEDIAGLTVERAKEIYRQDFWDRYGYGLFEQAVAEKVFDLCVNMGPSTAHRLLQRALRAAGVQIEQDGILGPATRQAAQDAPQDALLAALRSEAAGRYRVLMALDRKREKYIGGWLSRAYS